MVFDPETEVIEAIKAVAGLNYIGTSAEARRKNHLLPAAMVNIEPFGDMPPVSERNKSLSLRLDPSFSVIIAVEPKADSALHREQVRELAGAALKSIIATTGVPVRISQVSENYMPFGLQSEAYCFGFLVTLKGYILEL